MTWSVRHDDEAGPAACPSLALYVHVPFCRARCAYCDFNTYAGLESLMPAYGRALQREIETVGERWGPFQISTIYVGGGTPSLLPLSRVAAVLDAVRGTFDLSPSAEITVEANPGTVDGAYLSGLRALGVDRLSIGAQSAQDEALRMLDRIHRWGDVVDAINVAREAGFENLSLDLLFGLPAQSLHDWRETLDQALKLHPDHLSLYGLTVESGTPLARRIGKGELPPPDEDRAAAMYELAEELLDEAGFFHYEISNWARMDRGARPAACPWSPGCDASDVAIGRSEAVSPYVCRHNLVYWRNQPWLGVGAGAHSWMPVEMLSGGARCRPEAAGGERWANVDHPADYLAAVAETACSASWRRDVEVIDRALEMGETMMLGLRLAEGVTAERFERRFGVALAEVFGEALTRLARLGLLAWDGEVARLTGRGRLLGNRVFARFI